MLVEEAQIDPSYEYEGDAKPAVATACLLALAKETRSVVAVGKPPYAEEEKIH